MSGLSQRARATFGRSELHASAYTASPTYFEAYLHGSRHEPGVGETSFFTVEKKKLRKKERKSFPVLFFLSTSQATTNFEEELAKCPLLNVFPPSLVTVGCLFNLTCKLFSLRTSSVEHGVDDAQTFYVFRSLGSAGVCQLISVVPCAPHVKARLKKVSQVM